VTVLHVPSSLGSGTDRASDARSRGVIEVDDAFEEHVADANMAHIRQSMPDSGLDCLIFWP